jgi:hypothetical protein
VESSGSRSATRCSVTWVKAIIEASHRGIAERGSEWLRLVIRAKSQELCVLVPEGQDRGLGRRVNSWTGPWRTSASPSAKVQERAPAGDGPGLPAQGSSSDRRTSSSGSTSSRVQRRVAPRAPGYRSPLLTGAGVDTGCASAAGDAKAAT